jgi:hypothetical protein
LQKQALQSASNSKEIEELKKAHARELADHVQQANLKYNDLLKQKMDDEDRMEALHKDDIAKLIVNWEKKVREAEKEARLEEQEAAKDNMDKYKA